MVEKLLLLQNNAYAPISHFPVSSIVVTKDGREFNGVNGTCAERTALYSMLAAGYKKGDVKEINVMIHGGKIGTPCFVCRQMIIELCDLDTPVNCYSTSGEVKTYTVRELCPHPFTEDDLV